MISQKTFGQIFYSNEHQCVEKKTYCWKITFIWKTTIIMSKAFTSKFILYVYWNVKWNQREIAPKKYPPKKTFFCLKWQCAFTLFLNSTEWIIGNANPIKLIRRKILNDCKTFMSNSPQWIWTKKYGGHLVIFWIHQNELGQNA
jgi:hypothetical protein